jgi:selenide,water dikinase
MDDAGGVYLPDGSVLFQSVDVIAPPCDDPYLYGRIAAANALSDLYARGAAPLCALHVLALPPSQVPADVAARILQGGLDALAEAGAVSLGGHTLKEANVFYGLAVTGYARPDQVVSMRGARPGDVLVLTKPIGTGIVIEQLKGGNVSESEARPVFEGMARLNASAARHMVRLGAHAATDVTGFGLGGHAWQLAQASGVDLVLQWSDVPVYDLAARLWAQDLWTGASRANLRHYAPRIVWDPPEAAERWERALFDPQTSGGLLIALPPAAVEDFCTALEAEGFPVWVIGTVRPMTQATAQVVVRQ